MTTHHLSFGHLSTELGKTLVLELPACVPDGRLLKIPMTAEHVFTHDHTINIAGAVLEVVNACVRIRRLVSFRLYLRDGESIR